MKNWKLYIWRVLEGIAIVITIFITPAALYFQYQSLQEQKILGAWQLITTKAKGNSGKIEALEFLNSKGVPLVGVDLSKAYLSGVNLKGANILNADFTNADLNDANFEGANLRGVNFIGADLFKANFTGADLWSVNFTGAYLRGVNFTEADLSNANFTGAFLAGANFTNAYLRGVNFDGAFVSKHYPKLPTAPKGYEFVVSKTPPKDGKIFIELIKTKNLTT